MRNAFFAVVLLGGLALGACSASVTSNPTDDKMNSQEAKALTSACRSWALEGAQEAILLDDALRNAVASGEWYPNDLMKQVRAVKAATREAATVSSELSDEDFKHFESMSQALAKVDAAFLTEGDNGEDTEVVALLLSEARKDLDVVCGSKNK